MLDAAVDDIIEPINDSTSVYRTRNWQMILALSPGIIIVMINEPLVGLNVYQWNRHEMHDFGVFFITSLVFWEIDPCFVAAAFQIKVFIS